MDFEKVSRIVRRIQERGNVHEHLDLIAGLPYEDVESFAHSFDDVYALKPEQLQLGFLKVLKLSLIHIYPDKELEVIAEATEEDSAKIKDFLENTPITVEHLDQGITFDIVVTLYHGDEYAKVRIANYHTNIVLIEHNGEVVKESEVKGEEEEGLTDRSLLNMKDIWDFINTVDLSLIHI